jgi:hypothetical protein
MAPEGSLRQAWTKEAVNYKNCRIVRGGTMVVMDYRTQDGLVDYGFSIEFQPDPGWRIYIVFRSCHQSLEEDTQSPYQAVDRHGRHYVNWSARLDSLGDARTVAALWAEITQRYKYTRERREHSIRKEAKRSQFVESASR